MIRIERSVEIAASCDTVFRALTEPEGLANWYEFATPGAIEPVVDGRYEMTHQGQPVILGKVLEIIPPNLLRHSFRFTNPALDPSESTVTWRIEESAEGCRVNLVHEQLDLSTGWDQLLPKLKAYCEG